MFQKQKNSSNDTVKKIAIGTAIAAAAGYAAGLLTAPKSGKDTRKDIKDTATKRKTEAEKELKKLHTELTDLLYEVKGRSSKLTDKGADEASDLLDKAKNAKEKARDLLSALHDGDAEDKELKQAIGEAGKAIDHIKKFLKK